MAFLSALLRDNVQPWRSGQAALSVAPRQQQGVQCAIAKRSTFLWQTRQILLRYGDACMVLEPRELIALFGKTARGLAELYSCEGDDLAGGL
jgi:hypothetical protein